MRILTSIILVAVMTTGAPAALVAQSSDTSFSRKMTFDVGTGLSRFGPHAFGGLEFSMQRWLSLRAEGLFSMQSRETWPGYRLTAASLTGVFSFRSGARVTPYILGGYALSASRGYAPGLGPLGAAGLRFTFGKLQPFIELRAQHRIGVPMSVGFRF